MPSTKLPVGDLDEVVSCDFGETNSGGATNIATSMIAAMAIPTVI